MKFHPFLFRIYAVFFVAFIFESKTEAQSSWPFDQRQILLVSLEGTNFPEDLVSAQIMDVFVRRGRVRWITQKSDESSFKPIQTLKDFQWQSPPAIRQMGLHYKADGIVALIQRGVLLELRWYSTADGLPLFYEKMSLPSTANEGESAARKDRIHSWLNDLWNRIPGQGYVVKRNFTDFLIEGVSQNEIKVGDQIELLRITKFSRHPVLKTLLNIESNPTGKATILSINDLGALAKIDYESQVDPIQEGDRYTIPLPTPKVTPPSSGDSKKPEAVVGKVFDPKKPEEESEKTVVEAEPKNSFFSEKPGLGILDLTARLGLGHIQHVESFQDNTVLLLTDIRPQLSIRGKLYLNSYWLLLADGGFGFSNYSGYSLSLGTDSVSSSHSFFGLDTAFVLPFNVPQINNSAVTLNAEFWLKAGWQNYNFQIVPISVGQEPTSKSISGFDLGLLFMMPLTPQIALSAESSRVFFASVVETPLTSGTNSDIFFWNLDAGAHYLLSGVSEISAGIDYRGITINYGAAGTRTLSSNSVGITHLIYYAGYTQKF